MEVSLSGEGEAVESSLTAWLDGRLTRFTQGHVFPGPTHPYGMLHIFEQLLVNLGLFSHGDFLWCYRDGEALSGLYDPR
jgi:hypothetical protein